MGHIILIRASPIVGRLYKGGIYIMQNNIDNFLFNLALYCESA